MQISAIGNIGGLTQSLPTQAAQAAPQSPAVGFGNLLQDMVGKVSELQNNADQSIQSLATGQGKGLHEVMLAVEKASISFQMLTQVRNKAVEAYQEIMRMPV
jgi:flagellar hook-basal body complex protein FliE